MSEIPPNGPLNGLYYGASAAARASVPAEDRDHSEPPARTESEDRDSQRLTQKSNQAPSGRRIFSSYLVAATSVATAVIITFNLGPVIKHSSTLFFCSIMVSSWYGGLLPGCFAALLSVIALDYYFVPPIYSLGLGPEDVADMIAFVATALFISWLNGGQKQAKESLRQARDELDAKVKERTTELRNTNEQLQAEIAERQAAEDSLLQAQTEVARMTRITTMGELAASIAHELNQPLGGIVMSGDACLRWLQAEPPNLDEARQAVEAIIRDGTRASNVLVHTRKLLTRGERLRDSVDINGVVNGVITLLDESFRRNGVSLRLELQESLPSIVADRIQLQQVMLNLLVNAMEAMLPVSDRPRLVRITTQSQPSDHAVVQVQDSGTGIDLQHLTRIFEAFYTTKVNGIGMGLAISRSIIEAHGGRLWAIANETGSTFCFSLPIEKIHPA